MGLNIIIRKFEILIIIIRNLPMVICVTLRMFTFNLNFFIMSKRNINGTYITR